MSEGQIIVLEGIDKAGKGTQCRLLHNAIKKSGMDSIILDFPDYSTTIGKEIRLFLDGRRSYSKEVQHLLLSVNRWEKKEDIEKIRKSGTMIIMDRYYQSNLEFLLTVKENYRKLAKVYEWKIINGEEKVEQIHNKICGLLKEKLNIFI